jgi:hypothetical protein
MDYQNAGRWIKDGILNILFGQWIEMEHWIFYGEGSQRPHRPVA